jgi:hypothetical protein
MELSVAAVVFAILISLYCFMVWPDCEDKESGRYIGPFRNLGAKKREFA